MKDILVHVDASERSAERIGVAARMAGDAHLTGLFVVPEPRLPGYMAAYALGEFMEAQISEARADAEKAEARFHDIAKQTGVHAEWRTEQGPLDEVVSRHSRYSDLVVVGKGDADDPVRFPNPGLAADLVMTCGRPVLVVPNAGHFETVGKRILVCWNAGREATRAVNDALPLMLDAEKVTVLSVNPRSGGDHGDVPSSDIALHLARHGVNAEAASTVATGIDIADVILARASDLGVDLIVTGAYGHSRTREWVFGGVTESLMHTMTVPCLMSH